MKYPGYGRVASGKLVEGPVPQGQWNMMTAKAAGRLDGLIKAASQVSNRATSAA